MAVSWTVPLLLDAFQPLKSENTLALYSRHRVLAPGDPTPTLSLKGKVQVSDGVLKCRGQSMIGLEVYERVTGEKRLRPNRGVIDTKCTR